MRYRWSDRTLSHIRFSPKRGVLKLNCNDAIFRVPMLHHKKGVFTISWFHPLFVRVFLLYIHIINSQLSLTKWCPLDFLCIPVGSDK